MSKFEIYDSYLTKKDNEACGKQQQEGKQDQEEASDAIAVQPQANGVVGDSLTLKSTPPPYIICQCTEENLLNETNQEGVLLRTSYLQGSYVMSRPTGYTNLAVSAAFLASGP